MREVANFLRDNPQVLVLLVICLVLGLGMFIVVLFSLASASPGTTGGEPSGSLGSWLALVSTFGPL